MDPLNSSLDFVSVVRTKKTSPRRSGGHPVNTTGLPSPPRPRRTVVITLDQCPVRTLLLLGKEKGLRPFSSTSVIGSVKGSVGVRSQEVYCERTLILSRQVPSKTIS